MSGLRQRIDRLPAPLRRLLSRENFYALLLCLLMLALLLATTDNAPQWIYQGF